MLHIHLLEAEVTAAVAEEAEGAEVAVCLTSFQFIRIRMAASLDMNDF